MSSPVWPTLATEVVFNLLIHHHFNQRSIKEVNQMKASYTSSLVAALLVGGTPSAYGWSHPGKATGSAAFHSGRNPAVELQQFGQLWNLPARQVVAVLVFLRSWLHNLLVSRNDASSTLEPGDAEVLLAYARWLDGIPQVVRALPERVLLEEAALIKLRPPAFLPSDACTFVEALSPLARTEARAPMASRAKRTVKKNRPAATASASERRFVGAPELERSMPIRRSWPKAPQFGFGTAERR